MALQMKGKKMTQKKSDNNSDTTSDYLTIGGVANYLSLSKGMIYRFINTPEENFPKPFEIIKSQYLSKKLFKKEDIISWIENKKNKS